MGTLTKEEINERIIEWVGERLSINTNKAKDWTDLSQQFAESLDQPPDGNDTPPDILPSEVALRLSKYGQPYNVDEIKA